MTERLRIPAVDDPDFIAEISYTEPGEGPVLRLAGSAHAGATAGLAALLAALHDELRARGARLIVVDVQAVEVMAAACFNELVGWVQRLRDTAPAEQYRIRVRSNPAIAWQLHSLAALACFDTELVRIEP